jgi:hypothetical protein
LQPEETAQPEAKAELGKTAGDIQWRDDNTAARVARSEAFEANRELRHAARTAESEARETIAVAEETVDRGFKAAGGFLRGMAKAVESVLDFFSDFLSPPPPMTKDQAERAELVAEEKQQARADQAAWQERTDNIDWLIAEMQRQQQQRDAEAPSPARKRDDDYDRGYERER